MNEDYKMTIIELRKYIKSDLIVSAIRKAMESSIPTVLAKMSKK